VYATNGSCTATRQLETPSTQHSFALGDDPRSVLVDEGGQWRLQRTAAAPNIQGVLYARGQSMDAIMIDGRGTFRSRLPVVAITLQETTDLPGVK
jgi:hypothetical protein